MKPMLLIHLYKTTQFSPLLKKDYCFLNIDLPTETEWEYAALGLNELRSGNNYRGKKKFPWDGEYTRSQKKRI